MPAMAPFDRDEELALPLLSEAFDVVVEDDVDDAEDEVRGEPVCDAELDLLADV